MDKFKLPINNFQSTEEEEYYYLFKSIANDCAYAARIRNIPKRNWATIEHKSIEYNPREFPVLHTGEINKPTFNLPHKLLPIKKSDPGVKIMHIASSRIQEIKNNRRSKFTFNNRKREFVPRQPRFERVERLERPAESKTDQAPPAEEKFNNSKTAFCRFAVDQEGNLRQTVKCRNGTKCSFAHTDEEFHSHYCKGWDTCTKTTMIDGLWVNNQDNQNICTFIHKNESVENFRKRTSLAEQNKKKPAQDDGFSKVVYKHRK
jgi:hypothetical protein